MKKSIITASILATGLVFSSSVNAATAASTLNVSASVPSSCTVATTVVNFGNMAYSQAVPEVFASGNVSVNCSIGVPYHIALDAGLAPNLAGGYRNMQSGASRAMYGLSANSAFAGYWGDDTNIYIGASVADTGSGIIQPHTVYGRAGAWDYTTGTPSPPGAYSDTVNVTVNY